MNRNKSLFVLDFYEGRSDSPSRVRSIFSSIAIKLNVRPDDFSSIAIKLTFVILGHGFKKADSVLYDICAPGNRTF